MDIRFSSTAFSQIEEIRDEIDLNKALLESLDAEVAPDFEERRDELTQTLKSLEIRLKDLESNSLTQQQYPGMVDGNDSLLPTDGPRSPLFEGLGRKRHQGYLDVEGPGAKSRRQSPSGAATPTSSVGTGSSSNSVEFLGVSPRDQAEGREHAHSIGKADPRDQVKADEEFARRLDADLNRGQKSMLNSSQPTFPRNSFTQSFFRADGTINRSLPRPNPGPSSAASQTSWLDRFNATPARPSQQMGPDSFSATQTSWQPNVKGEMTSSSSFQPMHRHALPSSQSSWVPKFTNETLAGQPFPSQIPWQSQIYGHPTGSAGYVYRPPGGFLHSHAPLGSKFNPYDLDDDSLGEDYPPPLPLWYDNVVATGETEEHLKNLLKQIRPDEELTDEERSQVPEGLKISLMKHQAAGVAWMKRMEESSTRGGILADDMGLGKTVQTIALLLARPPPPESRQPTLIVAPLALLRQWKDELAKFVLPSHRFNVLILHGPGRPTKWSAIKAFDVIITTYSTLATDLKRKLVFLEKKKFDPLATPSGREEFPLLGDQTLFHRVVLDEAQNIKNRATKSAVAACSLKATHRWCLTGTPMQNNTDEMFSLIKFCRIPPYNDYERFRRDIGQPLRGANVRESTRDRAMERLQALLKSIMLRRNKKSKIDGKPILQLPPKKSVEDRAHFDKDQLDFYRALETKAQIQFNKYVRAGTIGRNYSNALVLLLRLRQACCHPHLITNAADFALAVGNIADVNFKQNARALTYDVITRLKDEVGESEAIECPVCMDANDNPVIFACGHALCNDCLTRLTDNALNDHGEGSKPSCPHCRATIDATKITNLISFLKIHWPDHDKVKEMPASDNEDDANADDADDSDSDDGSEDDADHKGDLRNFIVADDQDIEDDTDGSESKTKPDRAAALAQESNNDSRSSSRSRSSNNKRSKGKAKAKDKQQLKGKSLAELRKEALKSKTAKKKYLKKLAKDYIPSAKIEKTLSLLEEIRAAGQEEKTIIFSSFTSFLDLLEVPLSTHPEFKGYVRYDGSMKRQDREEAVYRFREDRHCKVMLVSLKAGNAGLNLTVANHVIILDPFWNPFVEYQAADRCYRIGQTKEVTIHRILIGEAGREYSKISADDKDEDTGADPRHVKEDPTGASTSTSTTKASASASASASFSEPLEPDPDDLVFEDTNEDDFTVEDRIIKLQEKKKKLVEMALDERAGERIGRLGQRELGYLFGVNRLD